MRIAPVAFFVFLAVSCALGQRVTQSLDGKWDIADSVEASTMPRNYSHTVSVPGLVHSSEPGFKDVDLFESREHILGQVHNGELPQSALITKTGIPHQDRNYFWYRTTFHAPEKHSVARLRINKAQFGAEVWLNGMEVGQHLPCFSAAILDVSNVIRWSNSNELVIRIGAHPGVLPDPVNCGTDFEKLHWTPGIYDDVSLIASNDPVIETVQVAPHITPDTGVVIQTRLKNDSNAAISFSLVQRVHAWKESTIAAQSSQQIDLAPGQERVVEETLAIPHANLWSPESPNLYVLETGTGGDNVSTRFGVREFRFETATRRAYLNGKPFYMRGSNITLHRFFEDPESGMLPWNDAWVRKLLIDVPKQMHWNSFRFCIGPVPDKWLDIADEAGLLIQNEYFFWTGYESVYRRPVDTKELIGEYSEWMRDNWNHPSVVIWDASNETYIPELENQIISAVRPLDLSNRPWEAGGYNPPQGADDPVEDHPYEFIGWQLSPDDPHPFSMTDLEGSEGTYYRSAIPTGHAEILNEYGWLWLNRDGSPTPLTDKVYTKLTGPNATPDRRLETQAYYLAALTEYWRAYRHFAGVLQFPYLTVSEPGAVTSDSFRDVKNVELNPYFKDYVSQAFQPLGVFINFFQPKLEASGPHSFQLMLVNDDAKPASGTLTLTLQQQSGEVLAERRIPFQIAGLGQMTYIADLDIPAATGNCVLKATARRTQDAAAEATLSRRWVELTPPLQKNN